MSSTNFKNPLDTGYDAGMKGHKNSEVVGKFVIVKDLLFSDFMKDDAGNIKVYNTEEEASITCGMYEFPDVLVMQIRYNHIEEQ